MHVARDPVLYSVPCLVILLVFVATVMNMEARKVDLNTSRKAKSLQSNHHKARFPLSNVETSRASGHACSLAVQIREPETGGKSEEKMASTHRPSSVSSVHSETVRQLPLFEPRFGPKYKSDPRESEIQLFWARSAATCLSCSLTYTTCVYLTCVCGCSSI